MITILKHFASTCTTFGTAMFIATLFDQRGTDAIYVKVGAYLLILGFVFIFMAGMMEEKQNGSK